MSATVSAKWFTRFKQSRIDSQYLTNMIEATEFFTKWAFGPVAQGFNAMLQDMHRIASAGGYTGHTNRSDNHSPLVSVAGQFRGMNKESWRPLLKKKWFATLHDDDGLDIWPELDAINLQELHHLVNRDDGYELHLPHERNVPMFLTAMAETMSKLKDRFSVSALANYIQYFVVGHPFERVNFSVCMAQVNAVLWNYGYEPIYHEYLDFECFVYDCDVIKNIVNDKLKRRQDA